MGRISHPISPADLLEREAYAVERSEWLRRASETKKPRRVHLDALATVLFESRDTVLAHVQEIVHVENVRSPTRIRELVDEHGPLVPRGQAVTATLFIDGGATDACDSVLGDLRRGLTVLWLRLGSRLVPAQLLEGSESMDPDGPVQYLRFEIGDTAVSMLQDPSKDAGLLLRCRGHAVFAAMPWALRRLLADELSVRGSHRPLAFDERRPSAI